MTTESTDKVLVYSNGATYWIDRSELYEPFPDEKKEDEPTNKS